MTQSTRSSGLAWWKLALLPWMVFFTWMAYYKTGSISGFPGGWQSARIIFWHVPMAWLAMIWFGTAAVAAKRYLYGGYANGIGWLVLVLQWLRPALGDAAWANRFQEWARGYWIEARNPELDRKVDISSQIGLVCTLAATATGSIFASLQWNSPWNWDPKEVSIAILILVYLAYFGLRMSVDEPDLRARLSAVYALVGAVAAPFLMYVIPNLPMVRQLHPPGSTVVGGMTPMWRLTYWISAVGFQAITIWIYQLRLRFDALANRPRPVRGDASENGTPRTETAVRRTEAVRQPLLKG